MMNQRILSIKLSAIYFAIFGLLACFYPYLAFYFQQRGLSYTEMGIAFALVSFTNTVAQPAWGVIADKYSNKRTVLLATLFFSSLAVYSLVFANGFYFVIGSIILLSIFQGPLVPVADAYCYELIKQYGSFQYGRIRLVGSWGYGVLALLAGLFVKYWGINSSYYLYSLIGLSGILCILSIDFKDTRIARNVEFRDITHLLQNKNIILLLAAVVFTNIAIGGNGSYIAILIEKTGGDVAQLGVLWFVVSISEIPALFFGSILLRRCGELNLYILGLAMYALRYLLDSLCTWYVAVLAVQLLQGVTYTFFLMASLEYINRSAPGKLKTVAMTMHAASIAIGGVIGNLGGGILLEYVDIFALFRVLAVVCLIGMSLLVVLKKLDFQAKEIAGQTHGECSSN